MNIILAAINAKYIHSNLAVYSIRAYANEYKEDIIIAEYTINQQLDDILMDLYKKKPDVLCFSCYIWNMNYIEELVVEMGKLFPNIPIWLGGPEVSYDASDVLVRLPQVTGVMRGEGEETSRELFAYYRRQWEQVASGIGLESITGITYRNERGMICENEWREVLDLSTIPFVYQELETFKNKIIYYETSRGCPFSCSYCLSSVDKRLRFRDIELVEKELQFFIDEKIPQVKFVDRTFNCNHEHAIAIWSYLLMHDNGITNFHFEVAADIMNQEELELIRQMRPGLIQLEIGVQSTNEKTVKEIKRKMDFTQVKTIVEEISAMKNTHQHLDLIVGLPYEDYERFQMSFNDVYGLHPEQLQMGFLKVLKGSYMEEQKAAYGLVCRAKPPYEVLFTNWVPYEKMLKLKGVEQMVEIYYNSGQFRNTLAKLEREFKSPFAMFESLSEYYEINELHLMNHSRITRYELLFTLINQIVPEKVDEYKELLTYDLYLRENVKNRPAFAGEPTADKEILQEIYDIESKEHKLLAGYDRCDKRQIRKMTHVERFSYDVRENQSAKEIYLLFDYQNRNPLTYEAKTITLEVSS